MSRKLFLDKGEIMKILVFDDNVIHRASARITLASHELTVVGSYDEAQKVLLNDGPFDVVLTDLMVFPSKQQLGQPGKFINQEMPLGSMIALLAIYRGVKNIAIVTDTNHHDHPASAALDFFGVNKNPNINLVCTSRPSFIKIDEATEELINEEFLNSDDGLKKYPKFEEGEHWTWIDRKGVKLGKNWESILRVIENLPK